MADITMDHTCQMNSHLHSGTRTDCDRQEALHILERVSGKLCTRGGWIRTYVRAIRGIENFLDSADCHLDIRKLCHCDFRRNARREAKCGCFFLARNAAGAQKILPSVTMPKVPSAPMKSLVVSNPADDLRAL